MKQRSILWSWTGAAFVSLWPLILLERFAVSTSGPGHSLLTAQEWVVPIGFVIAIALAGLHHRAWESHRPVEPTQPGQPRP